MATNEEQAEAQRRFSAHEERLTFVFANRATAAMFKYWMAEMGEGSFSQYLDARPSEEMTEIVQVQLFDYHTGRPRSSSKL